MDNTFGIRVISSAGFSRVEVPINSTFLDLKKAITYILNVHEKEQKLFLDPSYKSQIKALNNTSVTKLGIKYINNIL